MRLSVRRLVSISAYISAAVIFLAVVFWQSPELLFRPMGWCLYRNDYPTKNADAVLLLMGEPEIRPAAVAKAIHEGYASQMVFVTPQSSPLEDAGLIPSEESLTLSVLQKNGISTEQILKLTDYGRATSTADEATAIAKSLKQNTGKIQRLVVVTSWPHSSRAGWILEKALHGQDVEVQMLPIDQIPFSRDDWWHSERGLLFVFEEYIKYARYYVKYLGREVAREP